MDVMNAPWWRFEPAQQSTANTRTAKVEPDEELLPPFVD